MIAIPVKNSSNNPEVDSRFGRSSFFCIVDNKNKIKIIPNTAKEEASGAGGQAVKLLADADVSTIISPQIGPKAIDVLIALEIEVYNVGNAKTVNQAITMLKDGILEKSLPVKPGLRRV